MSRDGDAMSHEPPPAASRVVIEPLGAALSVMPGQSILEAALAAGLDMPRSCRNGTCRACLCRIQSGQVRYRIEWPGLSLDEKEEGCVLPCVALPVGEVVLHAPAARRRGG
jgi:ferredoxin